MASEGDRTASPLRVEIGPRDLTIGAALRLLFPHGTALAIQADIATQEGEDKPELKAIRLSTISPAAGGPGAVAWAEPPELPPDLFAATAALLDWSGAAHHVVPQEKAPTSFVRPLVVSREDRERAVKAAGKWRKRFRLEKQWRHPRLVRDRWADIIAAWETPVFVMLDPTAAAPDWWKSALLLLMTADEASASFGFSSEAASAAPLRADLDWLFDQVLSADEKDSDPPTDGLIGARQNRYTMSTASPDVACVLPKSRTASVGCTLRSLSHNLALLPPRGLARANWHSFDPSTFEKRFDLDPLNLLLVPYPFEMPVRSFSGVDGEDWVDDGASAWFVLESAWRGEGSGARAPVSFDATPDAFVNFVEELLRRALRKVSRVGGLVLPELSVPIAYFEALAARAERAVWPDDAFAGLEFIVAGVSTDHRGEHVNLAASCMLASPPDPAGPAAGTRRRRLIGYQHKHHRWRIDRSQNRDYGLGGALPGGRYWWEQIELRSRALNVFHFRESSTFAALICEDLARLEPVHALVRSIGPNLVFALLMDGPQVSPRWPGRYAMGLSDDPGSSVLTLSSAALIDRFNARCVSAYRSESVGMWRDETGSTREIKFGPTAAGVLLSLSAEKKREFTIDGRSDGVSSIRWVFGDQAEITLSGA